MTISSRSSRVLTSEPRCVSLHRQHVCAKCPVDKLRNTTCAVQDRAGLVVRVPSQGSGGGLIRFRGGREMARRRGRRSLASPWSLARADQHAAQPSRHHQARIRSPAPSLGPLSDRHLPVRTTLPASSNPAIDRGTSRQASTPAIHRPASAYRPASLRQRCGTPPAPTATRIHSPSTLPLAQRQPPPPPPRSRPPHRHAMPRPQLEAYFPAWPSSTRTFPSRRDAPDLPGDASGSFIKARRELHVARAG